MDFMTFAMFAVLALIISVVLIGLYFVLRGGQKKRTSQKPVAGREGLVVAARLVRDKQTGLLLVVMDGNLYTRVSELSAGQRQREECLHCPVDIEVARVLGAEPVSIIWADTFPALLRGAIDGEGNTCGLLYAARETPEGRWMSRRVVTSKARHPP